MNNNTFNILSSGLEQEISKLQLDLEEENSKLQSISLFKEKLIEINPDDFRIEKGYVVSDKNLDLIKSLSNYVIEFGDLLASRYLDLLKYEIKESPRVLKIDLRKENVRLFEIEGMYFTVKTDNNTTFNRKIDAPILMSVYYIGEKYELRISSGFVTLNNRNFNFVFNNNFKSRTYLYRIDDNVDSYYFIGREHYILNKVNKIKDRLFNGEYQTYPFLYSVHDNSKIIDYLKVNINEISYVFMNHNGMLDLFEHIENRNFFWSELSYNGAGFKGDIEDRRSEMKSVYGEIASLLQDEKTEVNHLYPTIVFHDGSNKDVENVLSIYKEKTLKSMSKALK
jgi:hypothetical protein